MAGNIAVTFLGTTSGGGPTETRNCSSLVLDALGNGSLWMVDCAEGTVRQFAQQPPQGFQRLRIGRVEKIFFTHMHADHTMGVITLLRNILGFAPDTPPAAPTRPPAARKTPKCEIFGPAGMRAFVRTILTLTHTRSGDNYCVHELLLPGEAASAPCDALEAMHPNESVGRDISCGEDGFWRDIAEEKMYGGGRMAVSAGSIVHRDPCIGYVFHELKREPTQWVPVVPDPRTVVILGDTSDPSALIPLVTEDPTRRVSLLVHEATDACMPPHIDSRGTTGRNRTHDSVLAKAKAKGHSTPGMAGGFARLIRAERLALNHLGARFPAPPSHAGPGNFRHACMQEIEAQATREWQPPHGQRAVAVSDFDRIVIPPNGVSPSQGATDGAGDAAPSGSRRDAGSSTSQPSSSRSATYQSQSYDDGTSYNGEQRGTGPTSISRNGGGGPSGKRKDNDDETVKRSRKRKRHASNNEPSSGRSHREKKYGR